MHVKSCEKQEKSLVVLTVEVGPDEFDAAIERRTRKRVGNTAFRGSAQARRRVK